MNRSSAPAILAACIALALAPRAAADEASERDGRALFKEGNQLVEQGQFVQALERFRAAYARFPNPKILLNIGTMLRQLGRSAEAADTYDRYLHDPGADAARRAEVTKLLTELDGQVGKLRVELADADARVRVDGKLVGEPGMPVALRVEPGSHTVVAERPGVEPVMTTVALAAGRERTVRLGTAKPVVASAAPSTPVAAPAPPQPVPAGAEPSASAPAPPTSSRSRSLAPALASLGVAAAGAVVGTVFLGVGLKAKSDFDATPTTALADRVDMSAIGADVGYGVAIAGGVVGLVLLLRRPAASPPSAADLLAPPRFALEPAPRGLAVRF